MAKVCAQLAFSLNFTPPPRDERVHVEIFEGSETLKKEASEQPPILTEPEHTPEPPTIANGSTAKTIFAFTNANPAAVGWPRVRLPPAPGQPLL